MKQTVFQIKDAPASARSALTSATDERFFNLWMNSFKIDGLTRDQREYILRRFWYEGKCAAFPIIKPSVKYMGVNAESFSEGLCGFAPFAEVAFNMYDFPTQAYLINVRGVPYIPNAVMNNHIDVVLGYAQHSKQPIRETVATYIKRIVDVEMTIRTNLIAAKMPVVIEVTPDSKMHAEDLMNKILDDYPYFLCNVKECDNLHSVSNGAPYIIDKLQSYKVALENELLTYLGIDNMGAAPQSADGGAREAVDAVNANNQLIQSFSDAVMDNLTDFFDEIDKVFGFKLTIERNMISADSFHDEKEDKKDGNQNSDDSDMVGGK